MRLVTFSLNGTNAPRIGARIGKRVLDLGAAAGVNGEAPLPKRMKRLLAAGDAALERVRRLVDAARAEPEPFDAALLRESEIRYLPPIPDADKFLCVGKNYRTHLEELSETTCSPKRRRSRPPSSSSTPASPGTTRASCGPRASSASTTSPNWCSSSASARSA